MEFKLWLEEEEIQQPYYRIVAVPLYGASAEEKIGSVVAPGTYSYQF